MRASHILLEYKVSYPPSRQAVKRSKAEAELLIHELLDRVQCGESFGDIAGVYSDCPSKSEGGDLGRFGKGQMVESFEKAVGELEIGQIGVCHTFHGYHVVKRTE